MNFKSRRTVFLALLIVGGAAHQLFAEDPRAVLAIPLFRGVSLSDLADATENEVSPSLDHLAPLVQEYVLAQHDLQLHKILSVSLFNFNRTGGSMVVDILGRDKSFATVDRDGLGGTGFIRAEVLFHIVDGNPSDVHIDGHKILLQRDYAEMSPHITVSLGDRLAVLEDDATGFRRSFPLGVGAIDEVHFKGVTTLQTPTTELSVLSKNTLVRKLGKPKYFRNKPFIPLTVPLAAPQENKPVRYRSSAIAFHIWQSPKFQRGFLSHGCMRMRDRDLDELLTFVEGVKDTVPVKIRIEKVAGAGHPFPYLGDVYHQVHNFGTKDHPIARKIKDDEGAYLTKLETTKHAPPAIETLTGMTLDPTMGPVPGGLMERDSQLHDKDD